ncbi:MAG: hypothetical protein AVDCRST_MAG76-729, partial [uncultured Acidimicrobiales bacterium]
RLRGGWPRSWWRPWPGRSAWRSCRRRSSRDPRTRSPTRASSSRAPATRSRPPWPPAWPRGSPTGSHRSTLSWPIQA